MLYYRVGVIVVSWVVYLWENYLSYRQYKIYKTTEKPPKELADYIDEENLSKARTYGIDKAKYGFFTGLINQILGTLKHYYFVMAIFWTFSSKLMVDYYGLNNTGTVEWEVFQSLIFAVLTTVISTLISMPQTVYYHFVLEERHGFNKQTWRFFVWDQIKMFSLNMVITTPITVAVIYIVRFGGEHFFLYLWIFLSFVTLVLTFLSGEIVALFDKTTPLPEGELRDKILDLAKRINFPLKQIYLVEGSKRSTHSNAYQAGLFNRKRVVLYDTLLKDHTKRPESESESKPLSENDLKKLEQRNISPDEILAIVCHELGHWFNGHLLKNMIFSQANLFIIFVIFSFFYKDQQFYSAFGFFNDKPVVIGLMLVMYILSPYLEVQGFIAIALSRRFEYEADQFAKTLGYAEKLKTGLVKLNCDNLGFPVHDELYSKFNHSHPTLIQRLKALGKTD